MMILFVSFRFASLCFLLFCIAMFRFALFCFVLLCFALLCFVLLFAIRRLYNESGRHPACDSFPFVSEGVLPSKRLLEMCRWMGSHFHN